MPVPLPTARLEPIDGLFALLFEVFDRIFSLPGKVVEALFGILSPVAPQIPLLAQRVRLPTDFQQKNGRIVEAYQAIFAEPVDVFAPISLAQIPTMVPIG